MQHTDLVDREEPLGSIHPGTKSFGNRFGRLEILRNALETRVWIGRERGERNRTFP
jgi:hypothetical protein